MGMILLLLVLAYVVLVWVIIWINFGIVYLIDIFERMRDNKRNARR